ANDLVARKILRDGGDSLVALLAEMRATDADLARHPALATVRKAHAEGCASVEAAGRWLAANHAKNPAVPGAVACSMLMLLGTVTGGWQLARGAVIASERLAAGAATSAAEREFLAAKLVT